MNKTSIIKKQSKLHPSELVHTDTGETVDSMINNNLSITMKEDSDLFTINSDEYVTFDSNAIDYIFSQLSKSDASRVFRMSNMLKTDCAVLFQNNNHPHNTTTLSAELSITEHEFYTVVRRLVKANVLAYAVCAPSGYVQKIYMLNPYIARKRKTYNCELISIFRDITKKQ